MESYITLSHLNDFIFCPRSIYFHQLYAGFHDQVYKQKPQLSGSAAHETIDSQKYSSRLSVLMGIEVFSSKYNIVGKIDVFDIDKATITERKKSIKQIYDGYIYQVYAQYFGLTEMRYDVQKIIIHDLDHNKNYPIALPNENLKMLLKFEETLESLNNFNLETSEFEGNLEKCKNCIYNQLCDKSLC